MVGRRTLRQQAAWRVQFGCTLLGLAGVRTALEVFRHLGQHEPRLVIFRGA